MITQPENEIQLEALKINMEKGHQVIYKKRENSLMIMGPTGAGKSTLTSKFGKLKLKAFVNQTTDEWAIIHQDEVDGPRIADPNNISISETVIPNQVIRVISDEEVASIIDCPGFADTKGYIQEIANSYYNLLIMQNTKKVKFILAVPYSSIAETKGQPFVQYLNTFSKIFKDVDLIQNSVAICITKAEKRRKVEILRNKYLEDIKNQNESLSTESKKIIDFTKNSTFIFYNPVDEGELIDDDLFERIYESIKYIDLKSFQSKIQNDLFNISISDEAKKLAQPLCLQNNQNLLNTVIQFAIQIREFFLDKFKLRQEKQEIYSLMQRFEKEKQSNLLFFGDDDQLIFDDLSNFYKEYTNLINLQDSLELRKYYLQILDENIDYDSFLVNILSIFDIFLKSKHEKAQINSMISQKEKFIKEIEFVKFLQQVCTDINKLTVQQIQEPFKQNDFIVNQNQLLNQEQQDLKQLQVNENQNLEIQPQDKLSNIIDKFLQNLKDMQNVPNVMVLGDKDVGKSTFISTFSKLVQDNILEKDDINFMLSKWIIYPFNNINIAECEGFTGDYQNDNHIFQKILDSKQNKKCDAFIIVISGKSSNLSQSMKKMFIKLKSNWGQNFIYDCLIVFVKFSSLLQEFFGPKEVELQKQFIKKDFNKQIQELGFDNLQEKQIQSIFLNDMIIHKKMNYPQSNIQYLTLQPQIQNLYKIRKFIESKINQQDRIDQIEGLNQTELIQKQILNLQVTEGIQNYQFFQTFYEILEGKNNEKAVKSEDSEQKRKILIIKKMCQYQMGLIKMNQKEYNKSIDHFIICFELKDFSGQEIENCKKVKDEDISQNLANIYLINQQLFQNITNKNIITSIHNYFSESNVYILQKTMEIIFYIVEDKINQQYNRFQDISKILELLLIHANSWDEKYVKKQDIIQSFQQVLNEISAVQRNHNIQIQNKIENSIFQQNEFNDFIKDQNQNFENNLNGLIMIIPQCLQLNPTGIDVTFGYIERCVYKGVQALEKYQYEVCLNIDLELTIKQLDFIISILSKYNNCPKARIVNSKANLTVGRLYFQSNQYNDAIKYLENAITLNNGMNVARELLADIYFQQQKFQQAFQLYSQIFQMIKALQCLKKKIDRDQKNALFMEEAADFCEKIGMHDKAIKYFYEAIQIHSENQNEAFIEKVLNKMKIMKQNQNQNVFQLLLEKQILPKTNFIEPKSYIIAQEIILSQLQDKIRNSKNFELAYRSSRDGTSLDNFEKKCGGIAQALIVFQSYKYNKIGGGYTEILQSNEFLKDQERPSNYLFSIQENNSVFFMKSKGKLPQTFIYQAIDFGDLKIFFGKQITAWVNIGDKFELPPQFQNDSKVARQFMGGQKNFAIKELEVFKVIKNDNQE